jgi:signal transduction histidine kinase/CheY-like chemotaxis protein
MPWVIGASAESAGDVRSLGAGLTPSITLLEYQQHLYHDPGEADMVASRIGELDGDDVLQLRRSVVPWVAVPALVMGWAWLNYELAVAQSDIQLIRFLAPAALMVGGAAAQWLRERATRTASWVLLLALTLCSVGATLLRFGGPAPYTFALTVSVAGLVTSPSTGLSLAGPMSLVLWLIAGYAADGPVGAAIVRGPIILLWAVAAVSSLASRNLYRALQWRRESEELARQRLEQTRQRQQDLNRTLRSLDEVYQMLLRTKQEEARARREAERSRQHTAQFAANVSHELRTPLNLIIGFSELMYSAPEAYGTFAWPRALRSDINEIYRNAEHLKQLIDDILDLSQVEAMRLPIIEEETQIAELIRDAAQVASGLLRGKDVHLHLTIDDRLPTLWVDPTRIRQVVLNLVTNACRFTEAGSIAIEARLDQGQVHVSIADTGIGMTPEQLGRVFLEFEQADSSLRRQYGGTGLGLALSKRFVELHHGRIWAESIPGQGSTFHFALPLPEAEEAIALPVVHVPESPYALRAELQQPREVVLQGASSSALRLLARYLHRYDFRYAESIEEAQRFIEQDLPWAVILSGANAQETDSARKLLEQANSDSALPLLTCDLWVPETPSPILQQVVWVTKPVDRLALLRTVEHLVPNARSVLVVDDDAGAVQLLRTMLHTAPHPFEVREAYGGEEALAAVATELPDVMLLDLLMPDVGGLEVLERLASDPRTRDLPVIMVTAGDALSPDRSAYLPRVLRLAVTKRDGLSTPEWLACTEALLDGLKPSYGSRPDSPSLPR